MTDRVVRKVQYNLKGQYSSFLEREEGVEGEEAIEALAEALAFEKVEGVAEVRQNKAIAEYLNRLWVKAEGKI